MTTTQELPGIDPRFHEGRNYLAPVTHKGKRILASFGSCKETGCNFSKGWTSNLGRDLGMWQHRAEQVREARLKYFVEELKMSQVKAAEMLMKTADQNSHTFENWLGVIDQFIAMLAGADCDHDTLPDFDWQKSYHLGVGAYDAAKEALDQAYEF